MWTPSYECHPINTESSLIPCKNKLQTYDQKNPPIMDSYDHKPLSCKHPGVSTRSGANCIVPESYVT